MADLCFRLDRAKNIDNKRLDRFEQKERTRKLRNEVSLKTAEERTPYLLGNDESGLISKSSLAMSEEVHQLKSAVEEAQREEEEALRVSRKDLYRCLSDPFFDCRFMKQRREKPDWRPPLLTKLKLLLICYKLK